MFCEFDFEVTHLGFGFLKGKGSEDKRTGWSEVGYVFTREMFYVNADVCTKLVKVVGWVV